MIKFYGYDKCNTCVKAKKMLKGSVVDFQDINITENPPTKKELAFAIKNANYDIKDLFNKSGLVYREMNMKEKLPIMSDKDLIDLLASNGRLVRRPFVIDAENVTIGFKEEIFKEAWSQ